MMLIIMVTMLVMVMMMMPTVATSEKNYFRIALEPELVLGQVFRIIC